MKLLTDLKELIMQHENAKTSIVKYEAMVKISKLAPKLEALRVNEFQKMTRKLKISSNDLYKKGVDHYTANKFLAGGELKAEKEAEVIKIVKELTED